jgi:hypothetical protein
LPPAAITRRSSRARTIWLFFYEIQGRHQEAEPLLRRVVAAAEHERGYDSPEFAASLNNLGVSLSHQGRYSEAESIYRGVLARTEAAHGPDHPEVAKVLTKFGGAQPGAGPQLHRRASLPTRFADPRKGARPEPYGRSHQFGQSRGTQGSARDLRRGRGPIPTRVTDTRDRSLDPEHAIIGLA